MATTSEIRLAHELLDEINARQDLTPEQTEVLRSFLPELPKQKTLKEITHDVFAAWNRTYGNDWEEDTLGDLEAWLGELYKQMDGLENVDSSPLPTGMRLANHTEFGRVVDTGWIGSDGEHFCVYYSDVLERGSYVFLPESSLTFIDTEPAKPAHPEFLQTGAEYQEAPWGTIVAMEDSLIVWVKKGDSWSSTGGERRAESQFLWGVPRKVLRWGEGV